MATLTITIPDAAVPRIRAAVAFQLGTEPPLVTAEVMQEFALDYMRKVTLMYERDQHEQKWQPEPFL